MQSVGHSVRPLGAHWTDGQRIQVLLSIMCPAAKDRLKGPRGKEASDCVDVGFTMCHVVKGSVPSLVVQEGTHMPLQFPASGSGEKWMPGTHFASSSSLPSNHSLVTES